MNKLEPIIERYKHRYILVERNDRAAIYEALSDINGKWIRTSYEAFSIKIKKETETFGKEYPEQEVYPSHEVFGKWAFSFGPNMLPKAKAKFLELSNPEAEQKTIDINFNDYLIRYYKEKKVLVVIKDKKIYGDQKKILKKYCKEVLKMLPEELTDITIKKMVGCIVGD
jgi:hypothetical protein